MNNYINNTDNTNKFLESVTKRNLVESDEKCCSFTCAESYHEWKTHLHNTADVNICTVKTATSFVCKLRKSVLSTKRYNQNTLCEINTNDYSILKTSLGL